MVTHYFYNQITEQWWESKDSADPLDLGVQHCGKAAVDCLLWLIFGSWSSGGTLVSCGGYPGSPYCPSILLLRT